MCNCGQIVATVRPWDRLHIPLPGVDVINIRSWVRDGPAQSSAMPGSHDWRVHDPQPTAPRTPGVTTLPGCAT